MKNKKINNDWYIYQNDIYGVNGLQIIKTKEALVDYLTSKEFLSRSVPEGLNNDENKKVKDLTHKFSNNQITNIEYAQKLLEIFIDNEGEIEEMHIEDFESLCNGESEFSKSCIDGFYSEMDIEELPTKVSASDKEDFKSYFDNAHENWVG